MEEKKRFQKKTEIPDNFGLRSPVIQNKFLTKKVLLNPLVARAQGPKNDDCDIFQASTSSVSPQQYEYGHATPVPVRVFALLSSGHQLYHRQPPVADAVIVNFRRQFFRLKPQSAINPFSTPNSL